MLSNSTPPTSSYTPNAKPINTSKRASYQGPRPLHLLDGTASPTSPIPRSPISPALSNSSRPNNSRRQSSISYNTPSSPLTRSASLGANSHRHSFPGVSPASSSGTKTPVTQLKDRERSTTGPASDVLTLAEKHRDLLHFIAQKESKCLELRTQLEAHEKELAELKKKWERIVSRGFQKSQSLSGSPNPSLIDPNNPAAVLDGIKGFFGLATPTSPVPPSAADLDQSTPRSNTFSVQSKANAHTPSSSTSTSTSRSSARYSQSSQSSIGDVPEELEPPSAPKRRRPEDILIVNDTGATPLVSPNSEFTAYFGDGRCRRRTSAEGSRKSLEEEFGDFQSGKVEKPDQPEPKSMDWNSRKSSKRMSLPVITPNDMSNVSSWVGTVGKTISKHPTAKRASILLSDVVQALTSPDSTSSPQTTSLLDEEIPSLSTTTLKPMLSPSPSPSSSMILKPKPAPSLPAKTSNSASLTLKPSLTRRASAKDRNSKKTQKETKVDDDDEWNW